MDFSVRSATAAWVQPIRFLRVLADSAPSFLTTGPRHESAENVKEFFGSVYAGDYDDTVVDGHDHAYVEQIFDVFPVDCFAGLTVGDIGSGDGSVFRTLLSNHAHIREYVGIDLAHPDKKLSVSGKIVQGSAYQKLDADFEVITAVNSLCYIEKLKEIELLKPSARANFFVVVEPWPGVFWNKHFDGIKLFYRRPEALRDELSGSGWILDQVVEYALLQAGGMQFWPLCYAALFKR